RTTGAEAADRKSPGRAEAAAPGEPAPKRGKKIRLPRSSDRYVFLKVVESIVPGANGLCMYDGKLFARTLPLRPSPLAGRAPARTPARPIAAVAKAKHRCPSGPGGRSANISPNRRRRCCAPRLLTT